MKANDANRYIVIRIEDRCAISTHAAEGEAQRTASEAAMDDEHDRAYVVYQQVGSAKAERKVTWEGAR